MLGSFVLVVVAIGGLERWGSSLVLVWVGCGAVGLTRAGERVAVRVAFGFRRPSPGQALVLQPVWATALRLSGIAAGKGELYLPPARQLNASPAGGGRSFRGPPRGRWPPRRAAGRRSIGGDQPGAGGPPGRAAVGGADRGRAGSRTGPSRHRRGQSDAHRHVACWAVAAGGKTRDRSRRCPVRAPVSAHDAVDAV